MLTYPDWGFGYMGAYTYQNSSNYTWDLWILLFEIIPAKKEKIFNWTEHLVSELTEEKRLTI